MKKSEWLQPWEPVDWRAKIKVGGLILFYFILQAVLVQLLHSMFNEIWIVILVTVISTPIFLWVTHRMGFEIGNWRRIDKQMIKEALLWTVGLNVFLIVYEVVLNVLGLNVQTTENQEILQSMAGQMPLITQVAVFGILGPLVEEVLFRSFIMRYFFPRWSFVGIGFSVYLFATAHVHRNFVELSVYLIMGFALSFAYAKKRQLEFPILIHLFNNLYAVAMMLLWP